nr:BLUF domain-containing protein [Chromobacterium sp. ASV5]
MALVHCIYCSALAAGQFDDAALRELLSKARRRNAELGVTGMLLFHRRSFFQVLEGERDVVEALFARIAADPRHVSVVKIILEPIAKRDFGDWSMGLAEAGGGVWQDVDGLNDFFASGLALTQLREGQAKSVLAAFRQGLWHMAPDS